jgi:hypothetical protein
MGEKIGYIIFIIFSFRYSLNAQTALDYKYVDSLTYIYYMSGEWNKIISLGKDAIDNNIDFKYLRQRMGYAFFELGNYSDARFEFEKAFSFDSYNSFTREYLYYSYLNTGKDDYAGNLARRLSPEIKKNIALKSFKPLESIEFEYNFKYAGTASRSNPQYYRLGINSQLAFGISLYQSFSNYKQVIAVQQPLQDLILSEKQPEYYACLSWALSNNLLIKAAYHFIYTTTLTSSSRGNLGFFSISPDLNRFSVKASFSALNIQQEFVYQPGLEGGYIFPGKANFSLTSSISLLVQQNSNRLIYNEKAGFKVLKNAWLEANLNIGRMNNYNDYNGLYFYNSIDPMTFRSGATFIYYLNKKITLWANYSFERKEYFENRASSYNQFSYLGGIKWKL